MDSRIIMRDSDEAAKPYTAHGWLSSNGHFYTDESVARYDGCTHVACRHCGKPTPKSYTACDACRASAETARFYAMPEAAWDGVAMLYSDTHDTYYASPDDALDGDETADEMRLVICTPNYVTPLEGDYCCDELADDMDVPAAVEEAMDAFNKAVAGIVLSWSPGKMRLKIDNPKEPQ